MKKTKMNKTLSEEKNTPFEIFIGLVSPLGCDKSSFIKNLKVAFNKRGYELEEITVTKLLIEADIDIEPKSLDYFIKMQICSKLRNEYTNSVLLEPVLKRIIEARKNYGNDKKVVYLIDQLKNNDEYRLLSYLYGLNYVQISLFSKQEKRDDLLKQRFANDKINRKKISSNQIEGIINNINKKYKLKLKAKEIIDNFYNEILADSSHKLMEKDFIEIDDAFEIKKSGQRIFKLFHKSHYFINLDYPEEKNKKEIDKFIALLFGEYKEYPTSEEFGMALAYQASVRSNFPGERHIGAAIISENGEVISVASIRAPSKNSTNPSLHDRNLIQDGYDHFHKNIKSWERILKNCLNCKEVQDKEHIKSLRKFISELIDFHPCTHAEISAILDAAKNGVSIRNATIYSTTFPCHLCAKDIINAGIKRVVYLEAYPKSKNRILYPNLIDFDPNSESTLIPFIFFHGVGPKRYAYLYSLDNKTGELKYPQIFKADIPLYYKQKEKDVINYIDNLLRNKNNHGLEHLDNLIKHKEKD